MESDAGRKTPCDESSSALQFHKSNTNTTYIGILEGELLSLCYTTEFWWAISERIDNILPLWI